MRMHNIGNNYAFRHANEGINDFSNVERCSSQGIGVKTLLLVLITFITALGMMVNLHRFNDLGLGLYAVVTIINVVLQLIICFSPRMTKVLSIPYAVSEGLLIGVLVGIIEFALPGSGYQIGLLSLVMTIAIFLAASILYTTGVIKVTNKFRTFMFVTLFGILIGSLAISLLSIFMPGLISMVFGYNVSLIVAIVFVVLAGLYVTISVDNAHKMVEMGLNKEYEWYAAYGILINLVWLYLEILRLLLILASKNRD